MSDNIGQKLKTLRKGRKLTQQELANQMNLTRATVSNHELGRRVPHLSLLREYGNFYGVGLDYFGVAVKDETFDLISRASEVFKNDDIPKEEKEKIYKEIMRLYLNI